jgi:hypothetical protein
MTIWLLALLLLASLAGLGYRQGGIKVAFSLLGIILGALLAVPLGGPVSRLVGMLGVKDPLTVWALGPLSVFVVFSIIAKVSAAAVHHKVDVYYKYHAGELRLALWERLNRRLGLCLGVVNATLYLILLSFVIYLPTYPIAQVANPDKDPKWMQIINRLGHDLYATGFAKVARSLDSLPAVDYEMVDFGALLYHNPLAQARLSSYPAFLRLADSQDFQNLGNDKEFTEAWQRTEPIMDLLNFPMVQAIRQNPELLKTIWSTVEPNLADARNYIITGKSEKFDAIRILGRWKFDVNAALLAKRRAKPTISSVDMQKWRQFLETSYSKALLTARPDGQVVLKSIPSFKPAAVQGGLQDLEGQWKDADGKYLLSVSGLDLTALVEGDRLTIRSEGTDLVFSRID